MYMLVSFLPIEPSRRKGGVKNKLSDRRIGIKPFAVSILRWLSLISKSVKVSRLVALEGPCEGPVRKWRDGCSQLTGYVAAAMGWDLSRSLWVL
jgi:hypothetical protein